MQIYLNGWMLGKYINDIGYVHPLFLRLVPSISLIHTGRVLGLKQSSSSQQGMFFFSPKLLSVIALNPRHIRILKSNSQNTLALSLWSLSPAGASLAGLELVTDGAFSSGLKIEDVKDEGWEEQKGSRPKGKVMKAM